MTILYLTLDPPLDPAVAATGNQVRARGIIEALERAGHRVIQVCPVNENIPSSAGTYRTDDELADMLDAASPDAILVGYWSLLHHLPQTSTPVILDFIAPRMLELMFQEPDNVSERTAEIIELLHRADHFLVGTTSSQIFFCLCSYRVALIVAAIFRFQLYPFPCVKGFLSHYQVCLN